VTSWATQADAIRHWPDAATLDPARLDDLLEAATTACAAYAPAPVVNPLVVVPPAPLEPVVLLEPAPVPVDYTIATVYQAREIYAASIREGDLIGAGDYAFRAVPLTRAVKALLRPEQRAVIG
jgi:hypothetical protein